MPLAAHLPWTQVLTYAESDAVALLPVGSTEAHGPHLPLAVDCLIAEEVCRRVDARLAARGELARYEKSRAACWRASMPLSSG